MSSMHVKAMDLFKSQSLLVKMDSQGMWVGADSQFSCG